MTSLSLSKDTIKILLLEGIHQNAVEQIKDAGFTHIEYHQGALSKEELKKAIKDAKFVGIRSRTQLTEEIFAAATELAAVGCFCIGTNQVDLAAAEKRGIPVFNAPFSNTRSVAELVIGELILLLRRIPESNAKAHRGQWRKLAKGTYEARGKNLGIIGYGHIGSQLSVLAEALGMNVFYYDIETKLSLGNAKQVKSLSELLTISDVVSLHVPENASTKNMIGKKEFIEMKKGAVFINAARGTVVDIPALEEALESQHIGGAAIDVFPQEPATNKDPFTSPLLRFDNVILTPHIGGSTEEAQENIGIEVANKLISYSNNGSTLSAVNFPEVILPSPHGSVIRFLNIHHNKPGVLTAINHLFADEHVNITAQYLQTNNTIGYVVIDIEDISKAQAEALLIKLKNVPGTVRARWLF